MKVGDLITATWPDGLQVCGRYVRSERGYIILQNERTKSEIPCNAQTVHFELGRHVVDTVPPANTSCWTKVAFGVVVGAIFGTWIG